MMSMSNFSESIVEQAALAWFEALGYGVVGGPTIAPGEPAEERRTYADPLLPGPPRHAPPPPARAGGGARRGAALAGLTPAVSPEGIEEAFRKLTRISSPQP